MTSKKAKPELTKEQIQNLVMMNNEEMSKLSMNEWDQRFFIKLLEVRNRSVGGHIKCAFKDVQSHDRKILVGDISDSIAKQLAEVVAPILTKLSSISLDISSIKTDISNIKDRLGEVEDKVEDEETKMKALQSSHDKILKEYEIFSEILERLVKTQSWWNIALRIAIAVTISVIFMILLHYNLPS